MSDVTFHIIPKCCSSISWLGSCMYLFLI